MSIIFKPPFLIDPISALNLSFLGQIKPKKGVLILEDMNPYIRNFVLNV